MKLAVIGAGGRGTAYCDYAFNSRKAEIAAVVEPNEERRKIAADKYRIPAEMQFESAGEFFGKGKLCDAVIIASMDRDHYQQAMEAIALGYDILLEKPISPDAKECIEIQRKANQCGCKVIVCHVLRYTNFFNTLKKIVDSGELGRILSIQHNENIGNYHMAHSFVRGNWRRSDLSSPLILQKACHDLDILTWLVGSETKRIASYGNLSYFKEENAPANSSDRCLTCAAAEACRFDARKMYLPVLGIWPASMVTGDQTEEGVLEALKTSPYGRCVYRCDNNVCDNQVTIIEYKNGVTVTFNLSGFTNKISRTIKIMCENGEIRGDDSQNTIEITHFAANSAQSYEQRVIHTGNVTGGHGGGDIGLMEDFMKLLQKKTQTSRTAIDQSIESHIMAFAAEQSRLSGIVADMDEFKRNLL
ncbi:MAG TPA: Gfo/Idh/MocA family oxidoreductase [Clostridiales bacterium]|nr:Gfo/Idh/MocA family oxidoreductase [Clostridiales bacterium]